MNIALFADFALVSEQRECSGADESGCMQTSLEDCARTCHKGYSMFLYGRSGGSRCYGDKCMCYCETALSEETCNEIYHDGYNLYKYVQGKMPKLLRALPSLIVGGLTNRRGGRSSPKIGNLGEEL